MTAPNFEIMLTHVCSVFFFILYPLEFTVAIAECFVDRKTNFTIIEASRDDVLAQKRKDPDPKEAFRYYQAIQSKLIYNDNIFISFWSMFT